MKSFRYIIFFIVTAMVAQALHAGENVYDSVPDSIAAPIVKKKFYQKGIIGKIVDYLGNANTEKKDKVFDVSFIAGPHYSSDTGFGIGVVAAGLYRMDRSDTIPPPSSVSLYGDATTGCFFKLGITGVNIFPKDRFRLNYNATFESFDTYFWGIGYDNDRDDANKSRFKYFKTGFTADFVRRLGRSMYIGPCASVYMVNGRNFEKPRQWSGLPKHTFNLGVGLKFSYDTRDFPTNAYKGVYLSLEQMFYPRGLFNNYAFSCTEAIASSYNKAWKGAVIASRLYGRFTYGNTPWGMLSSLGGSNFMRGYYQGRYIDKCSMEATVELRQHIWRRNGMVAWVGAGTVFPRFEDLRWRMILPNYGIGYRWEFKKRVNVRLDLGFGRKQIGFIFSIDEAF